MADDWDLAPVLDWLAREGRLLPDVVPLVDALGAQLLLAGAPLWRMTVGLQTIHPQLRAMGTVWRRDQPAYEQGRPHGIETSPAFIGSPLHELLSTGRPVRYRLDQLTPANHPVLHDVAAEGGPRLLRAVGRRGAWSVAGADLHDRSCGRLP